MSREHDDILYQIEDYVHGVLTREAAARVERHCEECADCRAELDAAERRLRDYRSVPPVEASEQLIRDTLVRVDRHERLRRVRGRFLLTGLIAAAASVLLLIGVQTYYSRLSAGDFDLRVLGQAEFLAGSNASLRVQLYDRKTGDAVGGVPVVVELRGQGDHSIQLASFTTDSNGTGRPRFEVPDWNENCELRVVASLAKPGPDTSARQPVQETITRSVQVKRSFKVMLSTDKPVYQPGQEIQVRVLAMRKADRKPVADEALVFSITDAKGNVIFKSQEKTSRVWHRLLQVPAGDGGDRGRVLHRVQPRRHQEPADGGREEVRAAEVQGGRAARQGLLPPRRPTKRHGEGGVFLRQTGGGRDGDGGTADRGCPHRRNRR